MLLLVDGALPRPVACSMHTLSVVADTDQFVVIHKPAGMAVHSGDGSVLDAMEGSSGRGSSRLHPVHRIDAETTGLLVLGKSSTAAAQLQKALGAPQTLKLYSAILRGTLDPRNGTWAQPLSQRPEGWRNPQGAKGGHLHRDLFCEISVFVLLLSLTPILPICHTPFFPYISGDSMS